MVLLSVAATMLVKLSMEAMAAQGARERERERERRKIG